MPRRTFRREDIEMDRARWQNPDRLTRRDHVRCEKRALLSRQTLSIPGLRGAARGDHRGNALPVLLLGMSCYVRIRNGIKLLFFVSMCPVAANPALVSGVPGGVNRALIDLQSFSLICHTAASP